MPRPDTVQLNENLLIYRHANPKGTMYEREQVMVAPFGSVVKHFFKFIFKYTFSMKKVYSAKGMLK